MNRRQLLGAMVSGLGMGAGLVPAALFGQQPPVLEGGLTVEQSGDYTGVPTGGLTGSVGQIPIGALPAIEGVQIAQLPNIAYLPISAVPGLMQALGIYNPNVLVGQVPGLLNQTIGNVPQFKNLLLGQLPGFGQIEGIDLPALLQAVTWDVIPGLLKLTLQEFLSYFGLNAIVPSMVELVTFDQYRCYRDGVLYVVDRGRPWQVGEYRYLTPSFRIKLDRIIDHGPGTGYYSSEVRICAFFACVWVGPLPWPAAYEQEYHLWLPPASNACL